MTPKLGCVGLGNKGEPLVRHLLLAGYEVLVHDARAEAVSRLDDTLASAAEALILAQGAGISPETFVEVINASNGRSYSTEVKLPRYVLDGSFDHGFALGLMVKDLKIALETAEELGLPMFVGSTLEQIWQAASAQGYGAEGHTAIYAFLEELALTKKES
jgi:3-hydroxyisobutyrate dehydrogenase-like beta-hydroxyacid dehydrogenase